MLRELPLLPPSGRIRAYHDRRVNTGDRLPALDKQLVFQKLK